MENSIKLRSHQVEAKNRILKALEQGEKRILVNAPCSWGKTKLVADLCHYWTREEKKKVLFVVPYNTLVQQSKKEFRDNAGLGVGIIAGGHKHSNWKTQVASIQALTRRAKSGKLDWFRPDLIVLDEAHETAFSGWMRSNFPRLLNGKEVLSRSALAQSYKLLGLRLDCSWEMIKNWWGYNKNDDFLRTSEAKTAYGLIKKYQDIVDQDRKSNPTPVIGVTGSPWRLKKTEALGDYFSHVINCDTPGDLLRKGWTTPINYYQISTPEIKKVKITKTGDYNQKDLAVECSNPNAVQDIVGKYKSLCPTRKFICFAVNIDHAKLLTEEFKRQKINAEVITGAMNYKERKPLFDRLGDLSDTLQGLVSVGCLSVGFNVPQVSCILGCRPTKSVSLFIQQVSRGIRLSEGKEDCVFIDQSGNLKEFGLLENITYPKDITDNSFEIKETPTKLCPQCDKVLDQFATICECGYHFPEKTEKKEKHIPVGELEIILSGEERVIYEKYRYFLKRAYQENYNPSWARMQCSKEFDKFPRKIWGRGAIFSNISEDYLQRQYWEHLVELKEKLAKKQENSTAKRKTKFDENWCQKWFEIEFGFQYKPAKAMVRNRPKIDPMKLELMYEF